MRAETEHTPFMRELEQRFKSATGLSSRANYKIFYGQIRPASVLVLGINPGGNPLQISADGRFNSDGSIDSSSGSFFESDEHDVLDCEWKENIGLRRFLFPYFHGDSEEIRTRVVKSNMAFRRSAKKKDIDVKAAVLEAASFLDEIIDRVSPTLILLTGVAIDLFSTMHATQAEILVPPQRDSSVKQVVFAASRVLLKASGRGIVVIQVAHASQFSWTYERYDVVQRSQELLRINSNAQNTAAVQRASELHSLPI